jgi:hypothetical protein
MRYRPSATVYPVQLQGKHLGQEAARRCQVSTHNGRSGNPTW